MLAVTTVKVVEVVSADGETGDVDPGDVPAVDPGLALG